MRMLSSWVIVLWFAVTFPDSCWAQRGIPVPRAVPHSVPFHPGIHPGGRHRNSDSDNNTVSLAIGGGFLAVVGLVLGLRFWRNRTVAHVRIIRTPPGEAPEEIRQAWVGVELPLRRSETEPQFLSGVGVLSRTQVEAERGYSVDGRAAVAALDDHSPVAAAWWRENVPAVLGSGYRLVFPENDCEKVE